jgi:hypothetical protein
VRFEPDTSEIEIRYFTAWANRFVYYINGDAVRETTRNGRIKLKGGRVLYVRFAIGFLRTQNIFRFRAPISHFELGAIGNILTTHDNVGITGRFNLASMNPYCYYQRISKY